MKWGICRNDAISSLDCNAQYKLTAWFVQRAENSCSHYAENTEDKRSFLSLLPTLFLTREVRVVWSAVLRYLYNWVILMMFQEIRLNWDRKARLEWYDTLGETGTTYFAHWHSCARMSNTGCNMGCVFKHRFSLFRVDFLDSRKTKQMRGKYSPVNCVTTSIACEDITDTDLGRPSDAIAGGDLRLVSLSITLLLFAEIAIPPFC